MNFGDASLPARYWAQVEIDAYSGCWLWTGRTSKAGYGMLDVPRQGTIHDELRKGNVKPAYAHRVMMAALGFDPERVDHACHVRRCVNPEHIRPATHQDNSRHRSSQRGSTSKYLGVSWSAAKGRWRAQAAVGELLPSSNKRNRRKAKYLGLFETEEEAARAYDRAVREVYGEFAALNFPDTRE